MGTKFAPTTFATRADDTLAAVDAYAIDTANQVTNALPDVNNALNIAGLKGLTGGNLSAGLSALVTMGPKGIKVNADMLLSGLVRSNPALNSAISQLSVGVKGNILNNSGYANITSTVNGLSSSINNTNLSDLTAVGSLIGAVSGSPYPISFTDVTGLTNLTTNIVVQASGMGMSGAYGQIATGLNNPRIMSGVTRNLAPVIINRSATGLLDEVSRTPYRSQLTAARPQFIQEYSRTYRAPQQPQRQSTYRPTVLNIAASFTRLDTNWKRSPATGMGPGTLNLSRGVEVSSDLDRLLQANANYASVPVPTTDYATMDTSCRNVPPGADYDMDLAQMSALKQALPTQLVSTLSDPIANLAQSFPLVALA